MVFLFISLKAFAITGINPTLHPPVEGLPLPIAHKINLEQAVSMILKTEIGQKFKPDIAELAGQGKIRLTALNELHYGESGEGCVVRGGQYFYEGFFIVLNEKQSIPELASSLIHETDHYRQIKRINTEKNLIPITIGWLEISAFATQLYFITELEQQGLSNRKALFTKGEGSTFDIMSASVKAKDKPSDQSYALAMEKMIEFGYPPIELQRSLKVVDQEHCRGAAN
ncbi:MAG: hypothetical protein ABL903_17675 [Methylococcales bacterium]